jgi:hypothetical protein
VRQARFRHRESILQNRTVLFISQGEELSKHHTIGDEGSVVFFSVCVCVFVVINQLSKLHSSKLKAPFKLICGIDSHRFTVDTNKWSLAEPIYQSNNLVQSVPMY